MENVLLDGDSHCKLVDFGLSKLGMFHSRLATSYCGTPCYMAPEVITTLFEVITLYFT
jgi:serine/threonine protein kinase